MGRTIGIDHGDKRFGIALSDPTGLIARPLAVVEGEPALLRELARLVAEEGADRIVLGLPINMDGTVGPKVRQVMAFKERLEQALQLEVVTWDERLTSFEAHTYLRQGGLNARQAAAKVDKVAAQILLQSFLDREKTREREARDDDE